MGKSEISLKDSYIYEKGIIDKDIYDLIIKTDKEEFSSNEYEIVILNEELSICKEDNQLNSMTNKLFINYPEKHILVLPSNVSNIIENHKRINQIMKHAISYEYADKIQLKISEINKITKLIECGGAIEELIIQFYNNKNIIPNSKRFILLYKIIIHLKNNLIDEKKFDKWIKLILENHYYEPALLDDYKINIQKFFTKCATDYNNGTIIIPLKTIGHYSTLRKIYENYYVEDKSRDWFGFIFDSTQMNGKISKEEDGTYYIKSTHTKNKITKILLITDIIMTGQGAENVLNMNFGKNRNRYYI